MGIHRGKVDRVAVLVMDSVGVGALPDAGLYGDEGSNTFLHVAQAWPLRVPALGALGIGSVIDLPGIAAASPALGAFGKMAEVSHGKDTTTGHWEMMGLIVAQPFPTYPSGFPRELIDELVRAIGRPVIGNTVASGTVIMAELGEEHVRTGSPIVYTSADSVLQIAAHEAVIPLTELYDMCVRARALMVGEHAVARIIARPFEGDGPPFRRTSNRRDFSLEPVGPTVLDILKAGGVEVLGIGKIEDIFAQKGLTAIAHTKDNKSTLVELVRSSATCKGLIFANCVDFDMLYGHRNDAVGYAHALEELDSYLPQILDALGETGVLFVTADHGCDPTTGSTDHSREYVPLLVAGKPIRSGVDLGVRATFADLGATVAELLGVEWSGPGTSFAPELEG